MPVDFEYVITRKEYSYVQCGTCSGSGKKKSKFKGNTIINPCSSCGGTGRKKLTRQTEVNILHAFKELNLIK